MGLSEEEMEALDELNQFGEFGGLFFDLDTEAGEEAWYEYHCMTRDD
jgi:hypothetical protein